MIDPTSVAFDIDGVLADTMTLFFDIAREEYDITGIMPEDITCYMVEECLDIDKEIIEAILSRIVDGRHSAPLNPIDGAPAVLNRLWRKQGPLLFVTARPYLGEIHDWALDVLQLEPDSIEIITTGSFKRKADVLLSRNISYFVEDRLETCFSLKEAGVTPVLFKQPWNREKHPFVEVGTWKELESLIEF